MNDRELLELAAKAAGYKLMPSLPHDDGLRLYTANQIGYIKWNPLTDDGDALRLAVKLGFMVNFRKKTVVYACFPNRDFVEDGCYRRAIVRAAAEIGAKNV